MSDGFFIDATDNVSGWSARECIRRLLATVGNRAELDALLREARRTDGFTHVSEIYAAEYRRRSWRMPFQ